MYPSVLLACQVGAGQRPAFKVAPSASKTTSGYYDSTTGFTSTAFTQGSGLATNLDEAATGDRSLASFWGMPAYSALITRCWGQQPHERPDAAEVAAKLQRIIMHMSSSSQGPA